MTPKDPTDSEVWEFASAVNAKLLGFLSVSAKTSAFPHLLITTENLRRSGEADATTAAKGKGIPLIPTALTLEPLLGKLRSKGHGTNSDGDYRIIFVCPAGDQDKRAQVSSTHAIYSTVVDADADLLGFGDRGRLRMALDLPEAIDLTPSVERAELKLLLDDVESKLARAGVLIEGACISASEAKEVEEAKKRLLKGQLLFNGLRARQMLNDRIGREGGFAGAADLASALGVTRATVAAWRRDGKILGIQKGERNYQYPVFQVRGDRALPGLVEVLEVMREKAVEPLSIADYLLQPSDRLDGNRPLDLLRSESAEAIEAVLEHARSYGEQGG